MPHEYHLPPDSPWAERLKHISADGSLDGEIKLARACAEALAAQGNVGAAQICGVIGRLAERNQEMSIRGHALMSADELRRLMFWIMSLLVRTCQEFVPEQTAELLADSFYGKFKTGFAAFRASGKFPALPDESKES